MQHKSCFGFSVKLGIEGFSFILVN